MNVLSLFGGIETGLIALKELGVKIDNYYSSEIDKYAISVARYNHPEIIELGDIKNWESWTLPKIDLILAGSPCQGFSFSGKMLNFDDQRSKLFFVFSKILKKLNPEFFLLENVRMKKESENVISAHLGVPPVLINSSLLSAQKRNRLYWSNLEIKLPEQKNINWGDIREYDVDDNFYYSEKGLAWLKRHGERKNKKLSIWGNNEKIQMIEASHYKKYSSQRFFAIEDTKGLRYITVVECARAQTLTDKYTKTGIDEAGAQVKISNTQRYKMIGNGWTKDVIKHILKGIL